MRTTSWAAIAGLLWLGGCATPPNDAAAIPSVRQSIAIGRNLPDIENGRPPLRPSEHREERLALTPDLLAPAEIEPDAVITLDPKSGALTPAMDDQLAIIANALTRDDRLLVRLEAYVPSGGSPALDIGIADQALYKVKARLVAQGISPRRMLFGSFGGEHGIERHSRRHWVEIYLVRRGYASDQP